MGQRNPRLRWLVVWVIAVVWMVAVLARLGYLQLFRYSDYLAKAQHQQQRIFEISPKRGTIYDRKGRELAVSLPMDSVFADPAEIADAELVARLLSGVLGLSPDDLETKIREAHTPVRLAKKLSPEIVKRIGDMNLRGVFFQKENHRVYPQRELAASVLGYVDVDEKGLGGIEYSLDKEIRGKPGKVMVMADGRRQLYDRTEAAADPGASVTLTIDETIQYIAEKGLATAIETTHARAGSVVIQDPATGDLLAVANYPVFDPNDPGKFSDDSRKDLAVSSAYEPGSTFKVITLTGAIENGITNPDELIDCQMGSIVVAGRLIHDHEKFGVISVRQILEHSSDVGAIKIALRLGSPKFYDVIRSFGIGQPTGIELPGESRGILRPLENWTPSSIGSVAMGQEVGVTPIQIISAISAVANGGTLNRPHIVREIDGGPPVAASPNSAPPQQATDARTAATMRGLMEDVMLEGTGQKSQLDGYTSGGKSGTAQQIDTSTKRYSATRYNASFVGFAPVNNPAVTILVVLDSPMGQHMGAEVSAPVFKRVAEQVLAYLGVPHDVPTPSDVESAKNLKQAEPRKTGSDESADLAKARFQEAIAGKQAPEGLTAEFGDQHLLVVPSLIGESVRGVTEDCSRMGLVPSLIGDGVALEQFPEAGTQATRGSRVTVRFGRTGEFMPTSAKGNRN